MTIESYVTLEEAETFFSTKIDSENWNLDSTSDDEKVKALVHGSYIIDWGLYPFVSCSSTEEQTLAFPRLDVQYYDEIKGRWRRYAKDEIPSILKDATCFQANYLIKFKDTLFRDDLPEWDFINLGNVGGIQRIARTKSTDIIAPETRKLMQPLRLHSNAHIPWMAN